MNAGHDLNRRNLTDFLTAVPGVLEVSIGHALIADALELGYEATVRDWIAGLQAIEGVAVTRGYPNEAGQPFGRANPSFKISTFFVNSDCDFVFR